MLDPSRSVNLAVRGTLGLGVMGMALFSLSPWGINVTIWLLMLVRITRWAAAKVGSPLTRVELAWLGGAFLGGMGFAYRMSAILSLLNFVMILTSLLMVAMSRVSPSGAGVFIGEIFRRSLRTLGRLVIGGVQLFARDVVWNVESSQQPLSRGQIAARGLLLAAPLLTIFCFLFARADQAFSSILTRIFDLSFEDVWSLAVTFILTTWLAGGLLRSYLVASKSALQPPKIRTRGIGSAELNMALVMVNLLFLSFVIVQIRYLFGGADLVALDPHLTYATYAREGFFQLVAVAVLVLPMLLVMDWILAPNVSKKTFRFLSLVLLLLLLVVMASALKRMWLYQAEFGQTELRFYVVAFIAWLGLVSAWLAATVLRGHAERFGLGVILISIINVITLNLMNPDGWILEQNMDRVAAGKPFDADYAASLSVDAVPVWARLRDKIAETAALSLSCSFAKQNDDDVDFRGWNYGRWLASKLLERGD